MCDVSHLQVGLYGDVRGAVGDEEAHALVLDERGRRADVLLLHGGRGRVSVADTIRCPTPSWWPHFTRDRTCRYPSESNRQIVTLFPHNTLQFRGFSLKRVQLYNENHPHGCRLQTHEHIRRQTNEGTEWGSKTNKESAA